MQQTALISQLFLLSIAITKQFTDKIIIVAIIMHDLVTLKFPSCPCCPELRAQFSLLPVNHLNDGKYPVGWVKKARTLVHTVCCL